MLDTTGEGAPPKVRASAVQPWATREENGKNEDVGVRNAKGEIIGELGRHFAGRA